MYRPPEPGNCSIVIRAYNEQEHLGRLLHGIKHQTVRDTELILVNSGSTDATAGIAQAFGAKVVHIEPARFTFGRSLNAGIRAATGKLVVIASAHVYPVYPDWLECLLRPFDDPNTALTYGKQRAPVSAKFSEQQVYRQWYANISEMHQPHPFCNNANAAIRRDVWLQRPYEETLPGLEDLEWAKWALEARYTISYVAEAEVTHIHREGWNRIFNRYKREAMALKRIYPESSFGRIDLLHLTVANTISDWRHAAQEGSLHREWTSLVLYRIAQFCGTFAGYRQAGALTEELRKTFYYPLGIKERPKSATRRLAAIEYVESAGSGGKS